MCWLGMAEVMEITRSEIQDFRFLEDASSSMKLTLEARAKNNIKSIAMLGAIIDGNLCHSTLSTTRIIREHFNYPPAAFLSLFSHLNSKPER
jgi:hypothetical protein